MRSIQIHKSRKNLKTDAILLLLADGIDTGSLIAKGSRSLVSSADPFVWTTGVDFVLLLINVWWVVDSRHWITDARMRKCLWGYVLLEAVFSAAIYLSAFTGCFALASILEYILIAYLICGIGLILRFL